MAKILRASVMRQDEWFKREQRDQKEWERIRRQVFIPPAFPEEASRAAHATFPPAQLAREGDQMREERVDADCMGKLIEQSREAFLLKRS